MSYTPNSTELYLAAFSGCLAGLGAQSQPFGGDASYVAAAASAFAQEVDTLWGGTAVTALDIDSMSSVCERVWADRSRLHASLLVLETAS